MKLVNKKARRNYRIIEEIEAGVVLKGSEVKSLRQGRGNLNEAFVRIKDGEAWVHNLVIPAYQSGEEYDPGRARKLLMHKSQLLSLFKKVEGMGLALVPLKCYFKNNVLKILVGLGRGKRQFEKREVIKQRQLKRELRREFKEAQIR